MHLTLKLCLVELHFVVRYYEVAFSSVIKHLLGLHVYMYVCVYVHNYFVNFLCNFVYKIDYICKKKSNTPVKCDTKIRYLQFAFKDIS